MILFNKDRALAGDPVITRDGREVKQLTWFEDAQRWAGTIDAELKTWKGDGSFLFDNAKYPLDLFMKPKTRTMTVLAVEGMGFLVPSQIGNAFKLQRITSSTVNPDGSVTVEVEEHS